MSEKILTDILGHVRDTNKNVQELDKKLVLHKQRMEHEISRVNSEDKRQNDILAEHIEGVQTLKALYLNHREETLTRLAALEEPRKLRSLAKKYILSLGALVAAGYAIYRFWDIIKGVF